MVWDGDPLLFTDATGIYNPLKNQRKTLRQLEVCICKWGNLIQVGELICRTYSTVHRSIDAVQKLIVTPDNPSKLKHLKRQD